MLRTTYKAVTNVKVNLKFKGYFGMKMVRLDD